MKKVISLIVCITLALAVIFAVPYETGLAADELGKVKGVSQSAYSASSVTLKWQAVKGARGYRIYKFDEKENKYVTAVKATPKTEIEIDKLKACSTYKFKVRAYLLENGEVVWGEHSEEIKAVTTPGKVGTIISSDIGLESITLSWSAAKGATGYQVFIYERETEKFAYCGFTKKCSLKVDGLMQNTLYTFKIRAVKSEGGLSALGSYSKTFSEFTHKTGTPMTNAQAAKVYNTAINKAKKQGDMTVNYTKTIETSALSCSKQSLLSTVSNQMSLLDGKINKTYKFTSGKSSGETPNSIIEPMNSNAALRGCDIKSFTASTKDGVFTLTLKLNSDKASFNGKTTAESARYKRIISGIKLQSIETKPIIVKSAVQTFEGASVTMKTKKGSLTSLSIKSPVKVDAKCKVASLSFKTSVRYSIKEQYTIK